MIAMLSCCGRVRICEYEWELQISSETHFQKLLDLPRDRRPTAVFAINDTMAEAFVQLVREKGLDVPRDISVAGFSDANEEQSSTSSWLTSYAQPTYSIGKQAARLLMKRIEDPLGGNVVILLQGELMEQPYHPQETSPHPN